MEHKKDFCITDVPIWKIVITATSDQDYSMDRIMVVENWPDHGDWTLVDGGHCSCYDFDETEWHAMVYTLEEIRTVAKGWREHGYSAELIAAPLILRYLGA